MDAHPVLRETDLWLTFLSADDAALQAAKDAAGESRRDSAPRFTDMLESRFNSVLHFMSKKDEVTNFCSSFYKRNDNLRYVCHAM